MIYFFVILAKQKIVFVLGMAHMTPFLCKLGPKMALLRDFSKKIFRTSYRITIKVINIKIESPNVFHWKPAKKKKIKMGVVLGQKLGQNRSNVVKKSKETGIINRFSSYFAWGIHFKGRNSGFTNT